MIRALRFLGVSGASLALSLGLVWVEAQGASQVKNPPLTQFVPGEGREKFVAYCSICHSTEYISMNAPVLDLAGWEKEVHKMVQVYGAPVPEEDQKAIVNYLSTHYSKDSKPSSK